jgi:hypothetical protein
MPSANGRFTEHLLFIRKSFLGGCFGCLGVGSAMIVIFVLVFGVFGAQFTAIIHTVTIAVSPILTGIQATPTAQGELPAIEVWVSKENQSLAPHLTQAKLPIQQPLFLWARAPKGATIHFTVRIVLPNGQSVPFGTDFAPDPTGKPISLGAWLDVPTQPGVYRIDCVIGATIVGSTVLTVVN